MPRRINARIDEELARELDRIGKLTGKSTTDLIKAALQAFCERAQTAAGSPGAILEASGFIGCASADPDLSARYKERLESWSRKA